MSPFDSIAGINLLAFEGKLEELKQFDVEKVKVTNSVLSLLTFCCFLFFCSNKQGRNAVPVVFRFPHCCLRFWETESIVSATS